VDGPLEIYTATRNDIYLAMVLFDREAVAGASIRQLADYATFRALSQALPETAEARASSIVGLFDAGAARPDGLTEFDRTYLATLYSGMPNIRAETRLAELERATGRNVFNN
jgi:hypothetical protein